MSKQREALTAAMVKLAVSSENIRDALPSFIHNGTKLDADLLGALQAKLLDVEIAIARFVK